MDRITCWKTGPDEWTLKARNEAEDDFVLCTLNAYELSTMHCVLTSAIVEQFDALVWPATRDGICGIAKEHAYSCAEAAIEIADAAVAGLKAVREDDK